MINRKIKHIVALICGMSLFASGCRSRSLSMDHIPTIFDYIECMKNEYGEEHPGEVATRRLFKFYEKKTSTRVAVKAKVKVNAIEKNETRGLVLWGTLLQDGRHEDLIDEYDIACKCRIPIFVNSVPLNAGDTIDLVAGIFSRSSHVVTTRDGHVAILPESDHAELLTISPKNRNRPKVEMIALSYTIYHNGRLVVQVGEIAPPLSANNYSVFTIEKAMTGLSASSELNTGAK